MISTLSGIPGIVTIAVLESTDSNTLIVYGQWDSNINFYEQYPNIYFRDVLLANGAVSEGFDLYRLEHIHINEGDAVLLASGQSFVTTIDVIEYYSKKLSGRKFNLTFNLKNGRKFENQPGYLGTVVMKNSKLTRAVTIGQWLSIEHFLAAVKNTSPWIMRPFLKKVNSLAKLNSILQTLGKLLKNRPEYHSYKLTASNIYF